MMHLRYKVLLLFLLLTGRSKELISQKNVGDFRVIVLYENGGHHLAYSRRAVQWLDSLSDQSHFAVDYIHKTDSLTETFLSRYQLFFQLDYPPYSWTPEAEKTFIKYITEGKGGWIGLHHATLLGDFDSYKMWNWFSAFMGGIRFKSYIPGFAEGQVQVEDTNHPVMKGLPLRFKIEKEEWYTYDKSPRPNVQVLACVDESTYSPSSAIKMGDHPVVWTNPNVKARNVYIFMGHTPALFNNPVYTLLLKNALLWAAGK